MYDYFFKWTNQAAAKADALMLADHLGIEIEPGVREWMRDHILPDVKAWRPSQDTVDGDGHTVHTYLPGWFAIVALNEQRAILLNADALQFALDRDACNAGQPFVIKNNIGAVISDVACEPVFAGSNYPIGGY